MEDKMSGNEKVEGIANFFSGKSVFLTGVTGFLGSSIAEKLLRSCPGIKNIFVLIRAKKGSDVQARLAKVTSSPLFNHLKKDLDVQAVNNATNNNGSIICSGPLSKLVPISGDMALPQLGLSPEDIEMLYEQVSVVIHSAATVKFQDPLKMAMKVNVEGTTAVLQLANKMKKLESLVHISTAYSNCERGEVKEVIYPTQIHPLMAIQVVQAMSDDEADLKTPKMIGKKPNTYTFTKHLAENLVAETAIKNNLPACIVRPSIVIASEKEPFPGWINNLNGPSGGIIALGTGIVHSVVCYDKLRVDVIPIDHVCHLVIAAAWETARTSKATKNQPLNKTINNTSSNFELVSVPTARNKDSAKKDKETLDLAIPIYHCCSGTDNPTTWREGSIHFRRAVWKYPLHQMVCFPAFNNGSTRTIAMDWIYHLFYRKIPFALADILWRTFGQPGKLLETYSRVNEAIAPLHFFTTHEFSFSTDNTKQLWGRMTREDRKIFNFDVRKVNWGKYYENYLMGLGKFTMKQDPKGNRAAQRKLRIFYAVHRLVQTVKNFLLLSFLKKWLKLRAISNRMLLTLTLLRTISAHLKMSSGFRKNKIML